VIDAEAILKERIIELPDYPKKGVIFRDITPLLKDRMAFRLCIDELARRLDANGIDYIAGIESRGFIVGAALAYAMDRGFVPIRKKGKLPRKTVSVDYALEYGNETIEVHEDSVERGSRVLIADDLLATGGTAAAAADLMTRIGAEVAGFAFLVELSELGGAKKLNGKGIACLVRY
jgi:adenine phosphoribosyltransferase